LVVSQEGKKIEIPITPVLPENMFGRALARLKAKRGTKKETKAIVNIPDENAQSMFSRKAKINNFGMYNYDCIYSNPGVMKLSADFVFEGIEINKENVSVYIVCPSESRIISYSGTNAKNFVFNPVVPNFLIAFVSGKKVMVFDKTDFASIDVGSILNTNHYTFKFKPYPKEIATINDIDQILSM